MAHDHDRGLAHDLRLMLSTSMSRRRMLGMFAGAAAGATLVPALVGCGSDDTTSTTIDAATGGTCSTIPTETAGPYPGDGTNGANALTLSGIVRSDIRSSIGTATGVAAGVPLTITLTLVNSSASCAPLVGYAVYLWHCDQGGNYSMYSSAVVNENYLRGVQVTDAAGQVTFQSIVPACYSGRWPHIHFEMYASLAAATNGSNKVAVSQLAMPKATCDTVFATTGYSASVSNLAAISLATDNVFSDDQAIHQLASVTGSVAAGYVATLTVPITA
jgi:protocatechuate 3,4-dioxygenase beta subunit